jgi:hypothetical protein
VSGGDFSHSAEGSWLWLASLSKLRNAPIGRSYMAPILFKRQQSILTHTLLQRRCHSKWTQICASQLLKATVVSVILLLPYDLADVLVDWLKTEQARYLISVGLHLLRLIILFYSLCHFMTPCYLLWSSLRVARARHGITSCLVCKIMTISI